MKKYKTVLMDETDHIKLEKLCSMHGRNMKEFTSQMIDFFDRTGMDPTDERNTNLKEAIKELRKENNRIISFIKQQEKTKLEPILDQMAVGYRTFEKNVGTLNKMGVMEEQLSKVLRNQGKLWECLENTRKKAVQKAIQLFSNYLKEQEWGKAIGVGKYVKNPKELNDKYMEKFFEI
ncbi:BfmA/BtgA family mobilization protein [Chondrinema litorale]|uniref:BfmA/BtgA family mobilization protein n=1 Tax=Chondrinema litorale TaxID=2994555 RepID=UPI0025436866|nr:BfmA/BtgA family mobilization protein [Chondrinema litorale]UZS00211.1 BfmA/BtgA family mobilization protein [Chondrinema litorale]